MGHGSRFVIIEKKYISKKYIKNIYFHTHI
jgi:hypothetical protein